MGNHAQNVGIAEDYTVVRSVPFRYTWPRDEDWPLMAPYIRFVAMFVTTDLTNISCIVYVMFTVYLSTVFYTKSK